MAILLHNYMLYIGLALHKIEWGKLVCATSFLSVIWFTIAKFVKICQLPKPKVWKTQLQNSALA